MRTKFLIIVLLSLFSIKAVVSQDYVDKVLYSFGTTVKLGAYYQQIKMNDIETSQLSAPVFITIPVGDRVTFSLSNRYAFSNNKSSDIYTKITGLSETNVGLRYVLFKDRLMLKCMVGIPTGVSNLTLSQYYLSKIIASNAFEYNTPFYGRGLNTGAGIYYVQPISRMLSAGAGGSYLIKKGFYPIDSAIGYKYDPGDEIYSVFGLNFNFGWSNRINVDLSYSYYFDDSIDGKKRYRYGPNISIHAGLQLRFGKTFHYVYASYRFKNSNTLYSNDYQETAETGNQLNLQYFGVFQMGTVLSVLVGATYKSFGDATQFAIGDMFEVGKSKIENFMLGTRIYLSDLVYLDLIGRYTMGTTILFQGNKATDTAVKGVGGSTMLVFKF